MYQVESILSKVASIGVEFWEIHTKREGRDIKLSSYTEADGGADQGRSHDRLKTELDMLEDGVYELHYWFKEGDKRGRFINPFRVARGKASPAESAAVQGASNQVYNDQQAMIGRLNNRLEELEYRERQREIEQREAALRAEIDWLKEELEEANSFNGRISAIASPFLEKTIMPLMAGYMSQQSTPAIGSAAQDVPADQNIAFHLDDQGIQRLQVALKRLEMKLGPEFLPTVEKVSEMDASKIKSLLPFL